MKPIFMLLLLNLLASTSWGDERFYVGGDKDKPISFGLEIEINLGKFAGTADVLKYYGPSNKDRQAWVCLDDETRITQAIAANTDREDFLLLPPCSPTSGRLITTSPEPSSAKEFYRCLPKKLYREGSGNLEFCREDGNEFIFPTLASLRTFLDYFGTHFGEGDVQGHVVFKQAPLPGATGYVIYEHDRAILRRLQEEYGLYLASAHSKVPGINLISAYLGLMTDYNKRQTKMIETWTIDPHQADDQTFSEKAGMVGLDFDPRYSFRVNRIAAPTLRSLGYPEQHIGFELRMEDNPSEACDPYHGCYGRLLQAMGRLATVLERDGSLRTFAPFEAPTLPYFNDWLRQHHDSYAAIFSSVLERLSEHPVLQAPLPGAAILQALISEGSGFNEVMEQVSSTYAINLNNFFFPLRPWLAHPILTLSERNDKASVEERVVTEQFIYLETMVGAFWQYHRGRDLDALRNSLRIAVAQWAYNVNLLPLFEDFEKSQHL